MRNSPILQMWVLAGLGFIAMVVASALLLAFE
jgi:hypothetical protein